jgi:outer membrane receptor protein involved in Fe transport
MPQLTPTGETGLSDVSYEHHPREFAAYLQNTIELNELIINLGLRYEWFYSDHQVLADPRVNPVSGSVSLTSGTELLDVEPKSQLSPRLGIAFPISDAGVIHVAYGHFLKLPPFAYIYDNSEYKIVGTNTTIVGNPDLLPQKTISYEVGLQQEIAPGLGVEVTMFYADFRNLLGLEVIRMVGNVNSYMRRVNRDYGFNKGIALAIRRTRGAVTGTLDYTYQISKGNESDPNNIAIISTGGLGGGITRESEKQVLPLDWDQRHTINGTLAFNTGNDWTFSLVGRASSGHPYTPEPIRLDVKTKFKNTESKPYSEVKDK